MIQIFIDYPLLLLFTVASLGYLVGSIKVKGTSLGVAAILFTGLAIGAIDPRLHLPEIILQLGLSIFVYSIGLSSGPAFFKSYRKNGFREILFILSMLILSGLIACLLWFMFGFSAATVTGIYSGSTTNTAALAGVIDYINTTYPNDQQLVQDAVLGYSFSYPMGVMGGIIGIMVMEKVLKIDYAKEQSELRKEYPSEGKLSSATVEISNEKICGIALRDLLRTHDWEVIFGRIVKKEKVDLINWDTRFEVGDIVMLVGNEFDLNEVIKVLGKRSKSPLTHDREMFDVRRIFVSNPKVVGRTLASLDLDKKYNAVITRIRRGDEEMIAKSDTILETGDRIRFIARREDLEALSEFFGDSYTASSKVNLFSFGLGIGLGLILGTIEISFGSEFSFKLGYAGGPLIVGLLLGTLRRTGSIVWILPYSANITLQQIGLILLLAAIGVSSGNALVDSLSAQGLMIVLASAIISLLTAFAILFIGYRWFKKPFSVLVGMVANQPAILDFAMSRSKNRIPVFGYAMMFPLALICKILIAQVLFWVLGG